MTRRQLQTMKQKSELAKAEEEFKRKAEEDVELAEEEEKKAEEEAFGETSEFSCGEKNVQRKENCLMRK